MNHPMRNAPQSPHSSAKPAIVVFDLGKVLVDFDYGIAGRKIAARSKLPPLEVQHLLDRSPLLYRFETGRLTRREYFEHVREATGFDGSLEEFGSFFADIFWEIPSMVEMQSALRRGGIPTYIFSNTNELAVEHIRRNFPFFSNFDGYILSYEVGALKPDANIYAALERMSDKRGAEVLYLDDRPENIAAGAARGWQVILQESPEKSWTAVKQAGLLAGA